MMGNYWNPRVIKKVYPRETLYEIREVHYNPDGTIYAYDVDPVELQCESVEALREYLQWCLNCLDKPVLEEDNIVCVDYDE